MGKYMKKSKIASDVAVMEVSPLGVRTRAKTLALQRLQKSLPSPAGDASSFSYLELRSRRLEKVVFDAKKQHQSPEQPKQCCRESPKSNYCRVVVTSRVRGSSVKSVSVRSKNQKEEAFMGEFTKESEVGESVDVGIEGSVGENIVELEYRDRSTRESTPCSLIRDSDAIGTPGSTTRQGMSTLTNQITNENVQRDIPTANEMDEFFAHSERQQQSLFMEKYNFDIVNDVPVPGRYEWVQVLH